MGITHEPQKMNLVRVIIITMEAITTHDIDDAFMENIYMTGLDEPRKQEENEPTTSEAEYTRFSVEYKVYYPDGTKAWIRMAPSIVAVDLFIDKVYTSEHIIDVRIGTTRYTPNIVIDIIRGDEPTQDKIKYSAREYFATALFLSARCDQIYHDYLERCYVYRNIPDMKEDIKKKYRLFRKTYWRVRRVIYDILWMYDMTITIMRKGLGGFTTMIKRLPKGERQKAIHGRITLRQVKIMCTVLNYPPIYMSQGTNALNMIKELRENEKAIETAELNRLYAQEVGMLNEEFWKTLHLDRATFTFAR